MNPLKSLIAPLAFSALLSLSGAALAADNPFAAPSTDNLPQIAQNDTKCGGEKTQTQAKCGGESKADTTMKCGAGKCGTASDTSKTESSKCGGEAKPAPKCGGSK
jgi:uncharacterized low-complexity protein